MNKKDDTASFIRSATGDHELEQSIIKKINFDRYEIEIELTESEKFLKVISVKVSKDFSESIKSNINPAVHDVEKYYNED